MAALAKSNSNEYIKLLDTRPMPSFFVNRVRNFIGNMDAGDYRCKIFNGGLRITPTFNQRLMNPL